MKQKEIERRYIANLTLLKDVYAREFVRSTLIEQTYISDNVRVRIEGGDATLTIKTSGDGGISRNEYTYKIEVGEARDIRRDFKKSITKLRHHLDITDGNTVEHWEVDEFLGGHFGLVIAEIELQRENIGVRKYGWMGKEVSGMKEYSNASLAAHGLPVGWKDLMRFGDNKSGG